MSQRGDSGTVLQATSAITTGSAPMAKRPRHPTIGPSVEATIAATSVPTGTNVTVPKAPRFDRNRVGVSSTIASLLMPNTWAALVKPL
jgi:hypothetical protein